MWFDETTIKTILNLPRLTRLADRLSNENYESMKGRVTKTTSSITGMPRGGSTNREDLLLKLVDMEYETWDTYNMAMRFKEAVRLLLKCAPLNDKQRYVLHCRYINEKDWVDVIESFNSHFKTKVSDRQVYRYHDTALSKLVEYFKEISDEKNSDNIRKNI